MCTPCLLYTSQDALLQFRRLRYLAELVVRHDDAIVVVVLYIIEEAHTVLVTIGLLILLLVTGLLWLLIHRLLRLLLRLRRLLVAHIHGHRLQ